MTELEAWEHLLECWSHWDESYGFGLCKTIESMLSAGLIKASVGLSMMAKIYARLEATGKHLFGAKNDPGPRIAFCREMIARLDLSGWRPS